MENSVNIIDQKTGVHVATLKVKEVKKVQEKETVSSFKVGKVYEMRFIGDSSLKVPFKCVSRTAKTVTLKSKHETIKRRIKFYDNSEYVLEGNYSMAPSIKAKNIVL